MKRTVAVTLCVGGLMGAAAGIAAANGEPVGDAREDNSGGGINRDLKGATHGHQGKLLKHGVSSFGKQIQLDGLSLYINTDVTPEPNYVASQTDSGAAVRLMDGTVTGPLTVVQVSETKLRLLFEPSAIGKPRAYGWYVAFEGQKPGDTPFDRAPNFGYEKHRLVVPKKNRKK